MGPRPGGGRHQKQVAGFPSREEAEVALAEALAGQGGGDARTVAGFLERVWLPAKQVEVERSTYDQYAWAVRRHVVPELGAVKLPELTPEVLDGWLARLGRPDRRTGRSPLGATSVRLVRKVLSMACEDAVERGLVGANPVRRTRGPQPADSIPLAWTVHEARRFLSAARGDRLGAAFVLAMVTGLRRGELLGLRWSDLDLGAGWLRISQQLVVEGGRPRLKPMDSKAERALAIAPSVVEMLVGHRRQQDDERSAASVGWRDHDLVFAAPTGGWVTLERFAAVMDRIVERAEVPRITSEGMRRTARALGRARLNGDLFETLVPS